MDKNIIFIIFILFFYTKQYYILINQGEKRSINFSNETIEIKLNFSVNSILQIESSEDVKLYYIHNGVTVDILPFQYDRFFFSKLDCEQSFTHELDHRGTVTNCSIIYLETEFNDVNVTLVFDEVTPLVDFQQKSFIGKEHIFIEYEYKYYNHKAVENWFNIKLINKNSLTTDLFIDSQNKVPFGDKKTGITYGFLYIFVMPLGERNLRQIINDNNNKEGGRRFKPEKYFLTIKIRNSDYYNHALIVEISHDYLLYPWFFLNDEGLYILFYFVIIIILGFVFFVFFTQIVCLIINCFTRNRYDNHLGFGRRIFPSDFNPKDDDEPKIKLPEVNEEEYKIRRETIKDEETCVICYDFKRNIKFKPCNHICCCEFCAKSLMLSSKKNLCPLCRAVINSTNIVNEFTRSYERLPLKKMKEEDETLESIISISNNEEENENENENENDNNNNNENNNNNQILGSDINRLDIIEDHDITSSDED